ncbi:MAG TPA: amino acid adenylation domain-containing protein, partial [Thermoanaerobaculia bacterium]
GNGESAGLPPLPIQYADYAVWQRERMTGARLKEQLDYWRPLLSGVPGLELPGDRPRPAVETFRGKSRLVFVAPAVAAGLGELAREGSGTLFMVLLSVFATLLLRWTGQTDLAVGSPIANRTRREVEGVIGFFANTVVLRTDLSGRPTFRELLRRVREVLLGAYSHEELPFERLVEELQPARDMSRNPLFQVMCVLQNQPKPAMPAGDLVMTPYDVDLGVAKFDLTLFWEEQGGGLQGLLEHNTDLFDDTTALRFYRQHEELFAAVLADPDRRLSDLPLLPAAERHPLLAEWNDAERAWPDALAAGPVHAWVEAQARRTPEAVAVAMAGAEGAAGGLTYVELNRRANRLAHALRRRGVGPEALVGISVERSPKMAVAALAVLKAGGALVALDPAYPAERLATIAADAGLRVLLTEESLLPLFPGQGAIAICLDDGVPFPEQPVETEADPAVAVPPECPMYAIYTSGSTGRPKGIVVPHRAFANLLAWQLVAAAPGPVRTLQFAALGFCVSFQEMFSAWCSGGTLLIVSEMARRDVAGLAALVAAEQIERLHLPYAALKHLAEAADGAGAAALPSSLREVITAGEPLRVTPAVRRLFRRLPGATLANQYGASETHVVSALTLAGGAASWAALPPSGRPVANVRIHLLDRDLGPVPIGVHGELCAGGACLPRGYLNDPVATAEKLVPDPFAAAPGARLYRTGDLARRLADGRLEVLGRLDGQVKIRGFRVEPGEVETVLLRQTGVRDAAVVTQAVGAEHRLVAYVVPTVEPALFPAIVVVLRHALKRALPEYMVPAAFVPLTALPVNANGKLDAAALPAPAFAPAAAVAPRPGRTPTERGLQAIGEEILRLPQVAVDDNFFEL